MPTAVSARPSPRIGFIGLGLMGHGIAKNLLLKGFTLTAMVHRNRAPLADLRKLGAKEAKSVEQLVKASDIVFLCVTGTPQVEAQLLGKGKILEVLAQLPKRAKSEPEFTIVDCSTAEPSSSAQLFALCKQAGAVFVDAPLARTPKEAEEGRLNIMVGASAAVFKRLTPVFQAFCENVLHVGAPGAGHTIKLLNNFIGMTTAAAVAEACAAAVKAGVSPSQLHRVVSAGAVNSGIFQAMMAGPIEGDMTRLKFALQNAQKDLRYYNRLAESVGMPSPVGQASLQAFATANALGFGEHFVPALLQAQEVINRVAIVPVAARKA
jgi:3-hydroxyisobutyrate dehydrogenase-like beta-hydroxyacid dehydrogenase